MQKRLSDAVSVGWNVLANLQVTSLDTSSSTLHQQPMFWLGQLEGILAEILDAIDAEDNVETDACRIA